MLVLTATETFGRPSLVSCDMWAFRDLTQTTSPHLTLFGRKQLGYIHAGVVSGRGRGPCISSFRSSACFTLLTKIFSMLIILSICREQLLRTCVTCCGARVVSGALVYCAVQIRSVWCPGPRLTEAEAVSGWT